MVRPSYPVPTVAGFSPVDLAATFASLLGIDQPSASVGTVLTQAIKNVPLSAQRTGVRRRAAAPTAAEPALNPAPGVQKKDQVPQ